MKIYGIYDRQAEAVTNIITAPTDGYAMRSAEMLSKEGSPYYDYSDDYKLIRLCDIDEKACSVSESYSSIAEFSALKKAPV